MAADHSRDDGTLWDLGEPVKRCARCKQLKSYAEFSVQRDPRVGRRRRYSSYCRTCASEAFHERHRKRIANDPEYKEKCKQRSKGYQLYRHYRVREEEYQEMLLAQGGVCAICGKAETRKSRWPSKLRRLAVDHDHKTGVVRGLLCDACNSLLGWAQDDAERLRLAIVYLEKHR